MKRAFYFMTPARRRRKEIERAYLEAARRASDLIPEGAIRDSEEPDFVIDTLHGSLGLELTEVLRSGDGPFRPVEEERFHRDVVRIAEEKYRSIPGLPPIDVLVYFWNAGDERQDKTQMALSLVEFVRSRRVSVGQAETFSDRASMPEGFGVIRIAGLDGPWTSGECGGTAIDEIFAQLASRIDAKNHRVPTYRANLPGSPLWLLLYSGFSVSRGMPIPHGLREWTHPFDFDRVLFFSSLDFEDPVVEIQKGPAVSH